MDSIKMLVVADFKSTSIFREKKVLIFFPLFKGRKEETLANSDHGFLPSLLKI